MVFFTFSGVRASQEEKRAEIIRRTNELFFNAIDDDSIKSCSLDKGNFYVVSSKSRHFPLNYKVSLRRAFDVGGLKASLEDLKNAVGNLCASYNKLMHVKYNAVKSFTFPVFEASQFVCCAAHSLQTLITMCNSAEQSLKKELFEELENMRFLVEEEKNVLTPFVYLLAVYASTYYLSDVGVKNLGDAITEEYSFLQKHLLKEDSPKRKLTGKEMLQVIIKMIDEKNTNSLYVKIMEVIAKDILKFNEKIKLNSSKYKTPQSLQEHPEYLETLNTIIEGTWWFQNNISIMNPSASLLGKNLSESRITSCLSKIEDLHTKLLLS